MQVQCQLCGAAFCWEEDVAPDGVGACGLCLPSGEVRSGWHMREALRKREAARAAGFLGLTDREVAR